ncbi:MAG: hypothetical protein AB1716_24670 [Planctomycetota bacterium]
MLLRDEIETRGLGSGWAGVWLVVVGLTDWVIVPCNLRGWTQPWGFADVGVVVLTVIGAVHQAARVSRLVFVFAYGCLCGLILTLPHLPGMNDAARLTDAEILLKYGLGSLAICTCTGLLCLAAAGWRRDRLLVQPAPHNRCEKCGYLLHGLPEPRCPECGCATESLEKEECQMGP